MSQIPNILVAINVGGSNFLNFGEYEKSPIRGLILGGLRGFEGVILYYIKFRLYFWTVLQKILVLFQIPQMVPNFYFFTIFSTGGLISGGLNLDKIYFLKWCHFCFWFYHFSKMVPNLFRVLTFFSIGGLISGDLISEFLKWYHFSKMVPNLFLVFDPFFNRGFNIRIVQRYHFCFWFLPFFGNGTKCVSSIWPFFQYGV